MGGHSQGGTAAGQRAFSAHVASSDDDIDAVDAETDETPVRSFKVSRSHQGKLFLDGIAKALANRGLVLLGIGENGFPAHKDGWTVTTYNTSPVQLIVAPKPVEDERFKGRDLMMKCLMLLVTVCTAIVGIALYINGAVRLAFLQVVSAELCLTQLYPCAIVWIVMITLIRNVKLSCLYRLSSELLPHTR